MAERSKDLSDERTGALAGGGPAQAAAAAAEPRVLIVAAEAAAETLRSSLEAAGLVTRGVRSPGDAAEVAAGFAPHLAVIDARLEAPAPVELIAAIKARHDCLCALLAPAATGPLVTLADHAGADAMLVEPVEPVTVRRLLAQRVAPPRGPRPPPARLPSVVVGTSAGIREVWRLVMMSARSSSSVVITGETGVGKEVVARALHRFSARRSGPFVAVNCAALPETLLESELFGHEKGAYTGAAAQHKGRFELAHEGTLFLDEIGDLPLALQVKLLRVLQERSFERLGGTENISVDVRVIAATHKDLGEELEGDRFRADLFYRLSVLSIHVPPLRARKSDVLGLWEHFVAEGTAREHRGPLMTSAAAQRLLLRHEWPGNIRELHNVAEHALTVALGDTIGPTDLPEYLSDDTSGPDPRRSLAGMTMKEVERLSILDTYEALGTVKAAAESLGISERKIHYRLKEYRKGLRTTGRSRRRKHRATTHPPVEPRPTLRILLAEDDDEVRWALAEFLQTEGYEVVAVPDGKALLEHLGSAMLLEQRDAPPDIIITDIRMPGLTGMQLLESVRNRGWTTPVVLISAFGDADTRRKADVLGATAFLDKPIDVGKLHRIIGGL